MLFDCKVRLSIVPKSKLSDVQASWIEERLLAPEHHDDNGPQRFGAYIRLGCTR